MRLVWVVGRGGLLGSALVQRLEAADTVNFEQGAPWSWADPDALHQSVHQAAARFALQALACDEWELYWAAGIGTMHSAAAALAPETAALTVLLQHLADAPALQGKPGRILLSSSAGGIYAGSTDDVVSEASAACPTTDYARAKLQQESLLEDLVARRPDTAGLVARFSTIYGYHLARGKTQGILAHIANSIVRKTPVQIYVPLDTIRDYIAADDAARVAVAALRHVPCGCLRMKIVASERPTTLSQIVSVFRRIGGRNLRLVTGISASTAVYSRRIRFCSTVEPASVPLCETSLVVGASRVLDAARRQHALGSRAAPADRKRMATARA